MYLSDQTVEHAEQQQEAACLAVLRDAGISFVETGARQPGLDLVGPCSAAAALAKCIGAQLRCFADEDQPYHAGMVEALRTGQRFMVGGAMILIRLVPMEKFLALEVGAMDAELEGVTYRAFRRP